MRKHGTVVWYLVESSWKCIKSATNYRITPMVWFSQISRAMVKRCLHFKLFTSNVVWHMNFFYLKQDFFLNQLHGTMRELLTISLFYFLRSFRTETKHNNLHRSFQSSVTGFFFFTITSVTAKRGMRLFKVPLCIAQRKTHWFLWCNRFNRLRLIYVCGDSRMRNSESSSTRILNHKYSASQMDQLFDYWSMRSKQFV